MEPLKVIIKEREVEYRSDYPVDWMFSAGDPYKFPVQVGDYSCFIKRFGPDSPRKVSGWQLLMKLRGKYEKNITRVYDFKRVEEDDEEVYYAFYECMEGKTLDQNISNPDIDLKHLMNDLVNAIRVLQRNEYWFADFTEKNIFYQKNGIFALVDVDSAHPLMSPPDNDMYGSKDYWILVITYYKKFLQKNNIRLTDINGINLNYLQIPFLILRLKLFQSGKTKDYNSPDLFNSLPSTLNELAPEITEIYSQVLNRGMEPLSQTEISRIEEITENKIIKNEEIKEIKTAPANLPVIKEFTTSNSQIENGGSFTLSWQIENADRLELYKNGARFKELEISQKNIALTDFADGTRQQSVYQLIAYKDLSIAKSGPLTIKRKEKDPVKPRKNRTVFIVMGVLLAAVALFFLFRFFTNKNYEIRIGADRLYENSEITIYGKELPDENSLRVFFNNTAGQLIVASADSMLVQVPIITDTAEGTEIKMSVNEGDKSLFKMPLIVRYQVINLFDSASNAKWIRAVLLADGKTINPSTELIQTSWPGPINDFHGFARTGKYMLEDSKEYEVLWTHPYWTGFGTIGGEFPLHSLPGKKSFRSKAGFVKDLATGQRSTDGVSFQVWVHYRVNQADHSQLIFERHKVYDETLMNIFADFPDDVPDDFTVELRVDAGNSPNVDWAAWLNPEVAARYLENPVSAK